MNRCVYKIELKFADISFCPCIFLQFLPFNREFSGLYNVRPVPSTDGYLLRFISSSTNFQNFHILNLIPATIIYNSVCVFVISTYLNFTETFTFFIIFFFKFNEWRKSISERIRSLWIMTLSDFLTFAIIILNSAMAKKWRGNTNHVININF